MKKVISLLLVVAMLFGMVSTTAYAVESDPRIYFETDFTETLNFFLVVLYFNINSHR